jgi:hypothetical protein
MLIDHADPSPIGENRGFGAFDPASRLSGVRVPAASTIDSPSMRRSSGPTRVGRIDIVALALRAGAA